MTWPICFLDVAPSSAMTCSIRASSSLPETCAGSRLFRILTCSVRLSVRSWSVPALMDISSVSLVCLIRRLIMLLTSSSVTSRRSLTSIFFTSALTWRMMDRRTLSLAFMAAIISFCSSSLVICKSSLIAWAALARAPPHDYSVVDESSVELLVTPFRLTL